MIFRKPPRDIKKILVFRTDRLGDAVQTLPVFSALAHASFDDVSIVCRMENAPIFFNHPHIKKVFALREDDVESCFSELQKEKFDALIVMVNDKLTLRLLLRLHDIPIRVGPLSKWFAFLHYNYPVLQKRSRSIKNEAEYNLDLLQILGFEPKKFRPVIFLSAEEKHKAQKKREELFHKTLNSRFLVVVHQGMRGSALNINLAVYASVVEFLTKSEVIVALTGGGGEESSNNESLIASLPQKVRPFVFNLSQQFDLRELAAFYSVADLYFGPSTGTTHIANAVGIKIVSVYSPIQAQKPIRWEPYQHDGTIFSPENICSRKRSCSGEKCPYYYCLNSYPAELLSKTIFDALLKNIN